MKATYNIPTKHLIIIGDKIKTIDKVIDEMGEWDTIKGLNGKPIYDFQLDFDDSSDRGEDTINNESNYNLQYVNLVKLGNDEYIMGDDWRNIEITFI